MESKKNDLFSGPINKVLWNATVIHEKRLGVLDEHIEKLLKNNDHDNGDYKNIELLNKKIDNLESFRKEFKEYKNDIKNIKDTLSLQDSGNLNEKIEELNNNKLSTVIYLNNIKEMRKTIKALKIKINKLSNDYNILNLSHEQLKLNYDNNNYEDEDEQENREEDKKEDVTTENNDSRSGFTYKDASSDAAKNAKLASNYANKKSEKIDELITTLAKEKTNIKLDIDENIEPKTTNVDDKNTNNEKPSWLKYKVKKNINAEIN